MSYSAESETIINWKEITDTELDIILRRARKFGRCLFTVDGCEVRQYPPVIGEVEMLNTETLQ